MWLELRLHGTLLLLLRNEDWVGHWLLLLLWLREYLNLPWTAIILLLWRHLRWHLRLHWHLIESKLLRRLRSQLHDGTRIEHVIVSEALLLLTVISPWSKEKVATSEGTCLCL